MPASSSTVRAPGACVHTTHGPVLGYDSAGVQVFKGLPYAGAPVGAGRWRRAPALAGWADPRGCYSYGPVCPSVQAPQDLAGNEWVFLLPRGAHSAAMEDCLRINLWAPGQASGLDHEARRPVMLWLHGQGFMAGSSQDFLATDGENLARTQDVLVASINHRVGPLGYLHLGGLLGEDDADAGNAGMLDIVDALRWLQGNAAAFGGDPGNITVFGQSGGGFKLSVLLAMPEARGLFHKAIVQSGARLRVHTPESATALVRAMLSGLGLADAAPHRLRQALEELPVEALLKAANDASSSMAKTAVPDPGFRNAPPFYWMPVAGVPSLPAQPFDPLPPACSAHVPLMVGTTLNEASPAMNDAALTGLGWDELPQRLQGDLGSHARAAIDALRQIEPQARPVEALSVLQGRRFCQSAVALCDSRCADGDAPVYNYLFRWCCPQFGGRAGAFHTGELPFVFANSALCAQTTGGSAAAERLAQRMSAAWAAFARTGSPQHGDLPPWPVYNRGQRPVMVFDVDCRVDHDPDRALLEVLPA